MLFKSMPFRCLANQRYSESWLFQSLHIRCQVFRSLFNAGPRGSVPLLRCSRLCNSDSSLPSRFHCSAVNAIPLPSRQFCAKALHFSSGAYRRKSIAILSYTFPLRRSACLCNSLSPLRHAQPSRGIHFRQCIQSISASSRSYALPLLMISLPFCG